MRARETGAGMEQFLVAVERRALVMAELALHDRDEALDLLQDAMTAFVARYRNHPREQWPPLFHRVLQNHIRDWHRRRRRRGRWWGILRGTAEGEGDPVQQAADPRGLPPDREAEGQESMARILAAVERLPLRQQQAFLLRTWEGLDVAQTAAAMGCSSGSVKTHLSRALRTLRNELRESGQ